MLTTLTRRAAWATGLLCLFGPAACADRATENSTVGPAFVVEVEVDPDLGFAARSGRVLVYLIGPDADVDPDAEPADAPFYSDPQPVYGAEVDDLGPGRSVWLDDRSVTGFPGPIRELPVGAYRVQAVFDWNEDFGSWRREPGNLYSEVVLADFDPQEETVVRLRLTQAVADQTPEPWPGVEWFEARSELLTEFRGREVRMRAGVVPPIDHDPGRAYPALYIISGFGGDHTMARWIASGRDRLEPGTPEHTLAASVFMIALDADGPHGHTLFADSANNGPMGRALVGELIPMLEARFNLIARPEARLVNGHSSGGWTTLWLATEYPDTFGAAWSSAPDPVDFHAFQKINIYEDENMYTRRDADGSVHEWPSYTVDGVVKMTIRQEIGVENAIGPRNASGEQWHSWVAVFAPRAADGRPADLWDPETGAIDHAMAERFRRYDITDRLRRDPGRFGPLFRERIRLAIGDADSYDLHYAVFRLRDALEEVWLREPGSGGAGSIVIVPGADHGSVKDSDAVRGWPADMVGHLRRSGLPVGGEL